MTVPTFRSLQQKVCAFAIALAFAFMAAGGAAAASKQHRVAIQIDQNDPAVMNMVLNNAKNVIEHYRAKNEDAEVEIVAYGPGLHMLRDDTSPVKAEIKALREKVP